MSKTAIIFEAHNDDLYVGVGGTLVKLVKQGYDVIEVVFSAGQMSHPHYKEEIIINKRIKEAESIGRQFGIKQTIFLGLKDNKLEKEIKLKDIHERIRNIIKRYDPVKIFCTTSTDPHPDHRAVNHAVMKVIESLNYNKDVYGYEVWNLANENTPVTYNDISDYFKAKIAMMKACKSQWFYMYLLLLPVYFRAKYYGIKNNFKYAEKLYILR
ncbi:MAG: PIG-L deacetylase family protein [Nanoarchaeota archaeon]